MERSYPLPYAEAACHVLGRLTRVDQNDLNDDPWVGDSLRAYTRSDLIGRGGLEELCEPLLRGTRGRLVEQLTGEESADAESGISASQESVVEAIPGQDVRTTIDVDLEQDIRAAFDHLNVKRDKKDPDLFADLHGAAVVIDIPTGEVRAMVSAPGFDPNMSDRAIAALNDDELNKPLFNRATCSMPETGSTIKPVVGIGAITQGVMGINDTIECTGFLTIQGREVSGGARCWTLSKFGFSRDDPRASHHRIPDTDPHPTGFLTFSDALQRSCNVFFENMGYRLGVDGLSKWMKKFGLGRITGVGIPEVRGRLPDLIPAKDIAVRSVNALWGGIGQGCVGATPIQMANVAATIARNGIWMRPRLVNDDVSRQLRAIASRLPTTQPSWTDVPDGPVDLQLSPPAVAAAQDGMWRVVNTKAGTGNELFRGDLQISGKTGTAQATPFSIPMRDRFGREIYDGAKAKTFYPEPSTPEKPNPLAPWYLGFEDKGSDKIELKHSWYIGFAPSHNPKIAFAVLVEYGGSGGNAAGTIAKRIIDECVERGYVPLDTQIREEVP
jgi:penicillin-binding protein 2